VSVGLLGVIITCDFNHINYIKNWKVAVDDFDHIIVLCLTVDDFDHIIVFCLISILGSS